MELIVSWLIFPLELTLIAIGCGLLVEAVTRRRLPSALIPGCGFAVLICATQFATIADATAELAVPVALVLALAGFGLGLPRRFGIGWRGGVAAAGGVFAAYAAPIVLSGDATFAGYIRLDDTATWLALTDRVMEHGRSLEGLEVSTYEATLAFNLADGYPVGVFLPLGIGVELAWTDAAWLIQPYMAWIAAILGLTLWQLARLVVASPWLRAGIAVVAAQAALLYGYCLWGGIKEVAAAALIALMSAVFAHAYAARFEWRSLPPIALAAGALVGVLSLGGMLWHLPAMLIALVVAAGNLRPPDLLARAPAVAAGIAFLAIPVIVSGRLLPPTSSPLTDDDAQGNLAGPLDPLQAAGIWPAGDFRFDPVNELVADVLVAVVIAAAAAGLVLAWQRRAWPVIAYSAGSIVSCALICTFGSPWLDAKALAIVSPAVLFAAGVAAAIGWRHAPAASEREGWGRIPAIAGALVAVLIAVGVVWSNALAYRDVNLAPRDQLAELESIGELVGGEGPALLTEYQPYGARHFLRDAEPEAVSELRRRRVALLNGDVVPKGDTADTDRLDPAGLVTYRTLVLRHSPVRSRPPLAYDLVWRGDYYDVWQRPEGLMPAPDRIGLGGHSTAIGTPRCADVRALARRVDRLVAARGRAPVYPRSLRIPRSWPDGLSPGEFVPDGPGSLTGVADAPSAGDYEVWLAGSVRPEVELFVDGERVGSVRHELNNSGFYVRLGVTDLNPGRHRVEVRFAGADLAPGSGGSPGVVGPLVLVAAQGGDSELVEVAAGQAQRLCGHRWDWIEGVAG